MEKLLEDFVVDSLKKFLNEFLEKFRGKFMASVRNNSLMDIWDTYLE